MATGLIKRSAVLCCAAGDTLLLEAARGFVRRHRYSRDFLLLSRIDDASIPDVSKAPVALGVAGLFVA